MAQPPFKSDAIQIEPGTTGTRTISRDATTNGLKFIDPVFTSGLSLSDLAGLQTVTGVYIVGKGGGATYTSIQDAVDAVPDTSSSLLPNSILIMPGVYTEDIVLTKDGVSLIGMGGVRIINATATETITIQQATTLIPKHSLLQNLTVVNADGHACVYVNGQNTYASGTITVNNTLAAGDTVTIGGVTLTGIAGTRTSGSNNFNASLGTVNALAAEIQAALADPANAFAASISCAVDGDTVTVTALLAGALGNTITLDASTTPAGRISVSGANLTSGGGLNSEVASEGVYINSCILDGDSVAFMANTVNKVYVYGGSWGQTGAANAALAQVGLFHAEGLSSMVSTEISYDTDQDQPIDGGASYWFSNIPDLSEVPAYFNGLGDLTMQSCNVGSVSLDGNQYAYIQNTYIGNLGLAGTTVTSLRNCTRGGVSTSGTPALAENQVSGTVVFSAEASKTVTFDVAQPDPNYFAYIDCPVLGIIPQVTDKTANGITIDCGVPLSASVGYTIIRQSV